MSKSSVAAARVIGIICGSLILVLLVIVQRGAEEEFIVVKKATQYATYEVNGRKPVIWLHLHKAGGTFMCQKAKAEHERVVTPGTVCNFRDNEVDGVSRMGKKGIGMSCERRFQLFETKGFTW